MPVSAPASFGGNRLAIRHADTDKILSIADRLLFLDTWQRFSAGVKESGGLRLMDLRS